MNEKTEKNPKGSGRVKSNIEMTYLSLKIKLETKTKLKGWGFKINAEVNKFLDQKASEIK